MQKFLMLYNYPEDDVLKAVILTKEELTRVLSFKGGLKITGDIVNLQEVEEVTDLIENLMEKNKPSEMEYGIDKEEKDV